MTEDKAYELIKIIDMSYRNFVKDPDEMLEAWYKTLYCYDFEDVKNRLDECMAEKQFQYQPPSLQYLVNGLPTKQDKVDFKKKIVYCKICKRLFNSEEELQKHFDRCSSVRYIVRQYHKWFKRDVNKKELYEMGESEFQEKYEKLLRYIQEHTTDEQEKIRIEFIFNPPGANEARRFINGK